MFKNALLLRKILLATTVTLDHLLCFHDNRYVVDDALACFHVACMLEASICLHTRCIISTVGWRAGWLAGQKDGVMAGETGIFSWDPYPNRGL